MAKKTSAAEKFFYENGGFSYDPKTETRAQGKRHSAQRAAKAEEIAKELGWTFKWEEDPEPYEMGDAETEHPDEVLMVSMIDENGRICQSLGGIGFAGSHLERKKYGRVVEADLALEEAFNRKLI